MEIEVIDNFLMDHQADLLEKSFNGIPGLDKGNQTTGGLQGFPWMFVNDLNYVPKPFNYYFTNLVVHRRTPLSPQYLNIFNPIVHTANIPTEDIWRLKVNLYPRTHRRVHHSTHKDYKPNGGGKTLLYYVNDNDGLTIFDGKKKVKSKKNRLAIFDGSIDHHSTTPTNKNWRCTINFEIFPYKPSPGIHISRDMEDIAYTVREV